MCGFATHTFMLCRHAQRRSSVTYISGSDSHCSKSFLVKGKKLVTIAVVKFEKNVLVKIFKVAFWRPLLDEGSFRLSTTALNLRIINTKERAERKEELFEGVPQKYHIVDDVFVRQPAGYEIQDLCTTKF